MNAAVDRYCVMGHPVAHSKSPWIHARFAELTGERMEYGRMLIPLDGFAEAVRAFRASGGKGCNVTVPFKFEAAALSDFGAGTGPLRRTPRAELAGACNVLHFTADAIVGDNTDGTGLVRDITVNAGVAIAGRRVLLVGAGGAAAGVLGPLIEARPAQVTVANRTLAKAQVLCERHAALARQHGVQLQACALDAVGAAYDILINGTASSLHGGEVPVPGRALRAGTLACDMMYGPAAQGFMAWAQRHGAVARDGLGMLVEQAAGAFEIWRGIMPPAAQVLAELRALMDAATA